MSPRPTSPLGLAVTVRDLVVMRVRAEFRESRGRYWRPAGPRRPDRAGHPERLSGAGYTDDIHEAGLWIAGQSPDAHRADPVAFLVARARECPSWCVRLFMHAGAHRSQEDVIRRVRTGVHYAQILRDGTYVPRALIAKWDSAGLHGKDRAAELERLALVLEGGDLELLTRLRLPGGELP